MSQHPNNIFVSSHQTYILEKPQSINKDRAEPTDTNDAVYFAHAGQLTDNKTPFSLGVISLPPVPNFATEVQTGMTNTIIMKNQIGCIETYRDHAVANKQGHKSKVEEAVQFCVPSNATVSWVLFV
jgi:hypothetical protein